jgi:hypothetical protein
MASTQIRGNTQIKDASVNISKLYSDFLGGSDWNITNGGGDATITGLATPVNAGDVAIKSYVDGLVDTTLKAPDAHDASTTNFPTDYKGSGSVNEGDTFYITVAGTMGTGTTVNVGDMIVANTDTPGQTDANWYVLESNRDQATESVLGVAKIATQSIANAGTNDTDIITALKLAGYLSNANITEITASEGLTKSVNDIQLGGAFTSDIDINSSTLNTEFYVNQGSAAGSDAGYTGLLTKLYDDPAANEGAGVTYATTALFGSESSSYKSTLSANGNDFTGDGAFVLATGGTYTEEAIIKAKSGNARSNISVRSSVLNIEHTNSSGTANRLQMSDSGTTFTDGITSKGIVYAGDYSTNFTDRSLVDKEYVDDAITAANFTFSNGLTESGGAVKLGGTLTEETNLTGAVEINIGDPNGTAVTSFNAYSTGTSLIGSDTTVNIFAPVNGARLNFQPTGTVATAISTTQYVQTYSDAHINGKETTVLDALNTGSGPGAGQDGYALTWSQSDDEYILTAIETPLTFENGLTEATGTVKLGGTLTEATAFDGAYAVGFGQTVNIASFDINSTGSIGFQTNTGNINFTSTSGIVYFGSRPARYTSAFSFTDDRMLVDKGYVDSHINGKGTTVLDALNTGSGPGATEDGYSLTWSQSDSEYVLTAPTAAPNLQTVMAQGSSASISTDISMITSADEIVVRTTNTSGGLKLHKLTGGIYTGFFAGNGSDVRDVAMGIASDDWMGNSFSGFKYDSTSSQLEMHISSTDKIAWSGQRMSFELSGNGGFEIGSSTGDFVIQDERATKKGIEYAADYSSAFTNRSLVDKEYVDAFEITASNGLTKTVANDVQLGGTLAAPTSLNTGTHLFTISGANLASPLNEYAVTFDDVGLSFTAKPDEENDGAELVQTMNASGFVIKIDDADDAADQTLSLQYVDSVGVDSQLQFNSTGMVITDNGTNGGIRYAADYATNFVARSLVDKAYVDGLVDTTLKSPDSHDASTTNFPTDYKGSGTVAEGDTFYITVAGTMGTGTTVNVGDLIVANTDTPGQTDANWYVLESNRDQATESILGVAKLATQAIADAGVNDTDIITPLKLATYLSNASITEITASNGLTKTVNNIALGGTLTSTTTLAKGGNNFNINGQGDILFQADHATAGYGSIDVADNAVTLTANNGTSSQSILLNTTTMLVTDTIGSIGLVYAGDYSANYTNRSLVDKEYVDDAITGAALTFTNGLTNTTGTITLGGTLTQNTTIDGDSGTYDFAVTNTASASFRATSGGTEEAGLDINSNSFTLEYIDGSGNQMMLQGGNATSGILMTDDVDSIGIVYAADYSANFVDRSLVDKGYSDAHINGKTTTVLDGLNTGSGPGAAQDGYSLTWSQSDGEYVLTAPTAAPNLQTVLNQGSTATIAGTFAVTAGTANLISTAGAVSLGDPNYDGNGAFFNCRSNWFSYYNGN